MTDVQKRGVFRKVTIVNLTFKKRCLNRSKKTDL